MALRAMTWTGRDVVVRWGRRRSGVAEVDGVTKEDHDRVTLFSMTAGGSRLGLAALIVASLAFVPFAAAYRADDLEDPAAIAAEAGPTVTPAARELLEVHVRWRGGWDALSGLQDVTMRGRLMAGELEGASLLRFRRDGRHRCDLSVDGRAFVLGMVGDSGWVRTPDGRIMDLPYELVLATSRGMALNFGEYLLGDHGVDSVTVIRPLAHDGRDWAALRFRYDDGDLIDILIDPATGASTWERTISRGVTTWTRDDDSRTVAGLIFPVRIESVSEPGGVSYAVTVDTVMVNTEVPAHISERPPPPSALLADGAAATPWIPVELYLDVFLCVRGEINGVAADIAIQSAAARNILADTVAGAVGLHRSGRWSVWGSAGTVQAGVVEDLRISWPGIELGPLFATVMDPADFSLPFQREMAAIIGMDLLRAVVLEVDYPGRRVRFHEPGAFVYAGQGRCVEVQIGHLGIGLVQLAVEGLTTGQFLPGTLYGHALDVIGSLADDVRAGRVKPFRELGGEAGSSTARPGTVRTIDLAGCIVHDVPVSLRREDAIAAVTGGAGILGARVLNRFRVVFDYPHELFWLEPGPDLGAPFSDREQTGLSFAREGDLLTVRFVVPGSPAERSGWRVGEQVRALDGRPVDDSWPRIQARWSRAAAGTVVRLTMANGHERVLALGEYYSWTTAAAERP